MNEVLVVDLDLWRSKPGIGSPEDPGVMLPWREKLAQGLEAAARKFGGEEDLGGNVFAHGTWAGKRGGGGCVECCYAQLALGWLVGRRAYALSWHVFSCATLARDSGCVLHMCVYVELMGSQL